MNQLTDRERKVVKRIMKNRRMKAPRFFCSGVASFVGLSFIMNEYLTGKEGGYVLASGFFFISWALYFMTSREETVAGIFTKTLDPSCWE